MNIDHNSSTPLHLQAESLLRKLIEKEEYQKGKLLPNEIELSAQLNISRNTLRQAINKLVFEGLLVRKKGFGTRVVKKGVLSSAKNWMSFSQEMKALGIEVCNFELYIGRKYPSEEVCSLFEVSPEQKLLVLERLRGKVNFPFVYFISYFNPSLKLTGDEDFTRPLYDIIEKDKGVILNKSKEEISALVADSFLSEKLEIKVGDPVLLRKRFVYDVNNNPVEYNLGYYRADSFTYIIECLRD
ncbi:GntR family transcriptional regulator [Coprobacter tertius]|uniref:GntR family transcriptional regulator n=1 Tax=Coprobacter tertius TaxID=2944915 RepID=A0ABT1MFT9_9BACT|nr:GntR family transcriptional regulator [Coprobacter tertius]MCP9611495.1 GntR family transcriptional regulator [Coprobacter tertius]